MVNPIWRQYTGIYNFKFYFVNNFFHSPNVKNPSDSFPKVYAGYQTVVVSPRYTLALQKSIRRLVSTPTKLHKKIIKISQISS